MVSNKGEHNHKRLPHLCLLGGPEEGGNGMSPLHSRGPQRQAQRAESPLVPDKGEQNQKWLPHPCVLGGPKEDGNGTPPVHSRGSPMPRAGGANASKQKFKTSSSASEITPYQTYTPYNKTPLTTPGKILLPSTAHQPITPLHSHSPKSNHQPPSTNTQTKNGPVQHAAQSLKPILSTSTHLQHPQHPLHRSQFFNTSV